MLLGGETGKGLFGGTLYRLAVELIECRLKEGRIVLPPTDNQEFIPLPDRSKPAGTLPRTLS